MQLDSPRALCALAAEIHPDCFDSHQRQGHPSTYGPTVSTPEQAAADQQLPGQAPARTGQTNVCVVYGGAAEAWLCVCFFY